MPNLRISVWLDVWGGKLGKDMLPWKKQSQTVNWAVISSEGWSGFLGMQSYPAIVWDCFISQYEESLG